MWFFISHLILFLFENVEIAPNIFIHSIICGLSTGLLLIVVERGLADKFLASYLELGVKKQDLEKWLYMIIIEMLKMNEKNSKFDSVLYIRQICEKI